MSRPTKQTDARVAALLGALRAGNTRTAAAAYAEVGRNTLYRWLLEDGPFRDSVEKAEADAEVRFAAQVAKAATDGTWQAAAWWLERRRPADFALRSKVEMTGKDGGPIESVDLTDKLSDHEKDALSDAIHAELARRADEQAAVPAVGDPRPGRAAGTTG